MSNVAFNVKNGLIVANNLIIASNGNINAIANLNINGTANISGNVTISQNLTANYIGAGMNPSYQLDVAHDGRVNGAIISTQLDTATSFYNFEASSNGISSGGFNFSGNQLSFVVKPNTTVNSYVTGSFKASNGYFSVYYGANLTGNVSIDFLNVTNQVTINGAQINSTIYTGTSNNTAYFGGNPVSYFANVTNPTFSGGVFVCTGYGGGNAIPNGSYGLFLGWNYNVGEGEVDYYSLYPNPGGGHAFFQKINSTAVFQVAQLSSTGASFPNNMTVGGSLDITGSGGAINILDRTTNGYCAIYRSGGINYLLDGSAGNVLAWDSSGYAYAAYTPPSGDNTGRYATTAFTQNTSVRTDLNQTYSNTQQEYLVNNLSQLQNISTVTDASSVSFNFNDGTGLTKHLTLANNQTIAAPTNGIAGVTYLLLISQDGTGSRTLTWANNFNWGSAGAPTLSTNASKTDLISVTCYNQSNQLFYAVLSGKGF